MQRDLSELRANHRSGLVWEDERSWVGAGRQKRRYCWSRDYQGLVSSLPALPLSSRFLHTPIRLSVMLRRKPTAIAITSEDIAAFEEARLRKLAEENKHPEHTKGSSTVNLDPSDELKPLPGDKARIVRSREERIGIARRG